MKRLGWAIATAFLEMFAIIVVVIALPTLMIIEFFDNLANEVRK